MKLGCALHFSVVVSVTAAASEDDEWRTFKALIKPFK